MKVISWNVENPACTRSFPQRSPQHLCAKLEKLRFRLALYPSVWHENTVLASRAIAHGGAGASLHELGVRLCAGERSADLSRFDALGLEQRDLTHAVDRDRNRTEMKDAPLAHTQHV